MPDDFGKLGQNTRVTSEDQRTDGGEASTVNIKTNENSTRKVIDTASQIFAAVAQEMTMNGFWTTLDAHVYGVVVYSLALNENTRAI